MLVSWVLLVALCFSYEVEYSSSCLSTDWTEQTNGPRFKNGMEGYTQVVIDEPVFDAVFEGRLQLGDDGLILKIPGGNEVMVDDLISPVETYYSKCLVCHRSSHDPIVLCFICRTHRNLWLNAMHEYLLAKELNVLGKVPLLPIEGKKKSKDTMSQEATEIEEQIQDEIEQEGESPSGIRLHLLADENGDLPEVRLGSFVLNDLMDTTTTSTAATAESVVEQVERLTHLDEEPEDILVEQLAPEDIKEVPSIPYELEGALKLALPLVGVKDGT